MKKIRHVFSEDRQTSPCYLPCYLPAPWRLRSFITSTDVNVTPQTPGTENTKSSHRLYLPDLSIKLGCDTRSGVSMRVHMSQGEKLLCPHIYCHASVDITPTPPLWVQDAVAGLESPRPRDFTHLKWREQMLRFDPSSKSSHRCKQSMKKHWISLNLFFLDAWSSRKMENLRWMNKNCNKFLYNFNTKVWKLIHQQKQIN